MYDDMTKSNILLLNVLVMKDKFWHYDHIVQYQNYI